MDREQEEAVLRITASYVAELEAGLHPQLSDYLARYPQYAEAVADFVAYYHAVEADLPPVDEVSHVAAEKCESLGEKVLYMRERRDAKRLCKIAEGRPGSTAPEDVNK